MRVLVINGPNLGRLGERDPEIYGRTTLAELEATLLRRAGELGVELRCVQHDDEGAVLEALGSADADAIIINPASLTHHSFALADAVARSAAAVYEVHISNIEAREAYRRRSLVTPVARGTIMGLGVRGYLLALEAAAGQEER